MHLVLRFPTKLLDEFVSNLLVSSLWFLSDDLVHANWKILETFGIFCFFYFFAFCRGLKGLKVVLLLLLYWVLFLLKFLLFTEQTLIFLEFQSSSNWLDMLFVIVSAVKILLIKMKIVCVLAWRVERKEEHWCFWWAIEWWVHMFNCCWHQIWLVRWLIVKLLVFMKVLMDKTLSLS